MASTRVNWGGWLKFAIIMAAIALATYGFFARFALAPVFRGWSGSILFGALGSVWVVWAAFVSPRGRNANFARGESIALVVARVAILGPFAGVCFWFAFKGGASLLTRAAGAGYQHELAMTTRYSTPSDRGRFQLGSCPHRVTSDAAFQAASGDWCIAAADYYKYPGQSVRVSVSGRRTLLGESIEAVRVLGPG
ncbi:hypothetical protein ABIE09_002508 [Lysobacter enzymogenes]|uniref:hypothetical protein n=1 Tax=Lysobacter enzymogenes TaxID=69 RepID=UPI0033976506